MKYSFAFISYGLRTVLHMSAGGVFYFAIFNFLEVSKIQIIPVLLIFGATLEYIEHLYKINDMPNKVAFGRDVLMFFMMLGLLLVFHLQKGLLSYNLLSLMAFLSITLMLLTFHLFQPYVPKGRHIPAKHVMDTLAYSLGPFVVYPILVSLLLV